MRESRLASEHGSAVLSDGLARRFARSPLEKNLGRLWLYDLLKPLRDEVVVCDPQKECSMREAATRVDKIDARRTGGEAAAHSIISTRPARGSSTAYEA